MSFQADRSIRLEVMLSSAQPELLQGLETWLRLGLISDAKVRQLCEQYLSCPLPPDYATSTAPACEPISAIPTNKPAIRVKERQPSWQSRMLQSFKAELSVRWLLFLGVFMVVVSSGVLAATQWERFPAYAQYAVLLSYTLIFWGVSFWASKQKNLQLTARTLQLVTLFLVPVNFWAMDGFRLWGSPLELVTIAIASVALTSITGLSFLDRTRRFDRPALFNYLALSYLHLGWGWAGFPVVAVYVGILGTTMLLIWRYALRERKRVEVGEGDDDSTQIVQANITNFQPSDRQSKIGIVVYALTVLLVRAIFGIYVAIGQLGLAIAICGLLFAWLSWQNPSPLAFSPPFSPGNWEGMGGGLLFFGWVVAIGADPSWQAIAVSGLLLLFFSSRLQRFWLRLDFTIILAIGLQAIWLFWRAIPPESQKQLIDTGIELAKAENHPYSLLSVVFFPYIVWILAIGDWLHRREKVVLAEFGESIAFSFGLIATGLSIVNPILRSLNLLVFTITLAIVYLRRPRTTLVYLTHITALLALFSSINYFYPNLFLENWATILLSLMVAELLFSITVTRRNQAKQEEIPVVYSWHNWRNSCWHIGLSLAGLSYYFYAIDLNNSNVKLLWLITPLTLTFVAICNQTSRRQVASWLSVVTLVMVQILALPIAGASSISLATASLLMLVNTRCLQDIIAALITIAFSLTLVANILWEGIPGFLPLSIPGWLVVIALAIAILWLLHNWCIERSVKALQLEASGAIERLSLFSRPQSASFFLMYARALDLWACALCVLGLSSLTVHSLRVYLRVIPPSAIVMLAIAITSIAIAYRHWRQPLNWGIFAIAWGVELLTAELLAFTDSSSINLSIANIGLGLISQLLGDWWRRRFGASTFPRSLHAIPLLYGFLGTALRWGFFTNWTGLSSIGVALIVIGVGRRSPKLKFLVYLGVAGITISLYELLLYQLLQSPGGAIGDGLIAMAALGTSIMYAYRLLSRWIFSYLSLSLSELKIVAHLHWAGSSCLLIIASLNPIQSMLLTGLTTGILLVRYAIFQGRRNPDIKLAEIWVYLGLLEVVGIRFYWLSTPIAQLFADPLLPWRAAIATVPAACLYFLPWKNWGWPKRPWQVSAFLWPLITILETKNIIHSGGLIIVAAFYILIAQLDRKIRFTYISAWLINWAIWRWFWHLKLDSFLWYIIPGGLSLLYIAQVDPELQLPEQRQTRHNLRLLGIGAICLVSLWTEQWTGLVSGILSIATIFAGLAFRVRAFLYIGTAAFLINVFNQLVILNFRYSFLKWAIGLVVGIVFIWIAANFETRREQITTLVRNWISELANWE